MDQAIEITLRAGEEAVERLVEECRKTGTIYPRDPKIVAQVSRTGKWHLNAIVGLRQMLDTPCADSKKAS